MKGLQGIASSFEFVEIFVVRLGRKIGVILGVLIETSDSVISIALNFLLGR